MAILVTGGAGFIGSHTAVELLEAGREVVIVDDFSNSNPVVLDRIREITGKDFSFYEIDVKDEAALTKVFGEHDIEAVIHFAGYKAVGESVEQPVAYYHNNIMCSTVLCRVMQKFGCKKMVFSSSATVYGETNPVPFVEDMPTSATNPYGWTKAMIERILTDWAFADPEVSVVVLRYFNPIGAHPSGLIGENPSGIPNNLFPRLTKVATGEMPCVTVWGDDYDTVDGTGVRDYIHVVDLAKGHLAALDYTGKAAGAQAVNLGTGRGTSVFELLDAFEKACGKKLPCKVMPRRPGDIASCYADCTLAKKLLGFTAGLTIDDMCRDGWNYIRS